MVSMARMSLRHLGQPPESLTSTSQTIETHRPHQPFAQQVLDWHPDRGLVLLCFSRGSMRLGHASYAMLR